MDGFDILNHPAKAADVPEFKTKQERTLELAPKFGPVTAALIVAAENYPGSHASTMTRYEHWMHVYGHKKTTKPVFSDERKVFVRLPCIAQRRSTI